MSLRKLCSCYVREKGDRIAEIVYFTTLAFWDSSKVERHKKFIRLQEADGVIVVYGEFKRRLRECKLCLREFPAFEEKQTDVNIAVKLLQYAFEGRFDKAIIISGDTDLLPAVKTVQKLFPAKQIGLVVPIGKASEAFRKEVDFSYKMKESHLKVARHADMVTLVDGSSLACPPNWK